MPKSLGQIHTVKFNYETLKTNTGTGQAFLCDSSRKLSAQFNRQIRMLSNYKLVGADLVVQLPENLQQLNSTQVIVKGRMRYMQPTKGRCDALRDAYQQLRAQAKVQGVDLGKNKLFDFRVTPRGESNYINVGDETLRNLTTLNGSDALSMTNGVTNAEVFDSYNQGIHPIDQNPAGNFNAGLRTQLAGSGQTDFVLNEELISVGNADYADTQMEEIPFSLFYDLPGKKSGTLEWRPDPALYVSIIGGYVEIVLDEITATGGAQSQLDGVEMDISLHFAGWSSIVRPRSTRKRMDKKKTTKMK